jgi:hypothetical protein
MGAGWVRVRLGAARKYTGVALCVAVGGAGPFRRGEGGWVWAGQGERASAERRARNTDSLLLPGQMPPTRL